LGSTVCEIESHADFSPVIFEEEFSDKHPREWVKQALTTFQDSLEAVMAELIAESDMSMQQLIPYRYPTCLQQWQGNEIGCSWNSLTCTLPRRLPQWPKEGFRVPH